MSDDEGERLRLAKMSHRRDGRGQDWCRRILRADTSEKREGLGAEGPSMLVAELAENVARQTAGARVVAQGQPGRLVEDQPSSAAMQLMDDPPVGVFVTIVGVEIGRQRRGATYEGKIIDVLQDLRLG